MKKDKLLSFIKCKIAVTISSHAQLYVDEKRIQSVAAVAAATAKAAALKSSSTIIKSSSRSSIRTVLTLKVLLYSFIAASSTHSIYYSKYFGDDKMITMIDHTHTYILEL